jgi:hypothetical protein
VQQLQQLLSLPLSTRDFVAACISMATSRHCCYCYCYYRPPCAALKSCHIHFQSLPGVT